MNNSPIYCLIFSTFLLVYNADDTSSKSKIRMGLRHYSIHSKNHVSPTAFHPADFLSSLSIDTRYRVISSNDGRVLGSFRQHLAARDCARGRRAQITPI